MQRRDFLRMSSLAALGGASTLSCAVHRIRPNGVDLSILAMEEVLGEVDAGVRAVRAQIEEERSTLDPSEGPLTRAIEQVFGGMYVYDAFIGMPVEGRAYPGMQHRIRAAAREFGEGMGSMRRILAEPDPVAFDAVDALLATEEGVTLVARHADRVSTAVGATFAGRRRMQRLLHAVVSDARQRGTRAATAEYLERSREFEEGEHNVLRADPGVALRFAEARDAWIRAGVPAASFDLAMPTAAERPGLRGWGMALTIIGGAGFIAGVVLMAAAPECWCFGGIVALVSLALLIPGIGMWAASGRPRKKPPPEPPDDPEETTAP